MIKISREIWRDNNYIKGYGYCPGHEPKELQEPAIWDEVYETCQEYYEYKYLKHFVRDVFTENKTLPKHIVDKSDVPYIEIPRGTRIWFIDIYLELIK